MDNFSAYPPGSPERLPWRLVAFHAVASAALLAAVCLLRAALHWNWLSFTWHYHSYWLWIVAADLAVIGLLGLCCGRPKRWIGWGIVLLPHVFVLGAAALLALQWFDTAAIWTLELIVCSGLAAAWLLVLGGIVALPVRVAVRSRDEAIVSRRWLRCWVAAAVFLGTAEAAVWLIERVDAKRPVTTQLRLPDGYGDDPVEERPIVALGGSTMLGFPYQPNISIAAVLTELLQAQHPDQTFPCMNLAETGINFRLAADRLSSIEARPRLLLLYTGHNEYFYDVSTVEPPRRWVRRVFDPLLSWSGSFRWMTSGIPQETGRVQVGPEASILRRPCLTAQVLRRRQEQFRIDLMALAEHCRRHEIPTLWFLPAASEGIFLPNRSVFGRSLSSREERELNERYRQCRRLIEKGAYEQAREGLAELCATYPEISDLEFWHGVCLRELGQIDAARQWFGRAIDHDNRPASVNSAYRTIIGDVAAQFEIEVIDAAEVLRGLSPTGLLDRHVIHDNVHPTLRGYYELGLATLRSATVAKVFEAGSTPEAEAPSFDDVMLSSGITAGNLATAYERVAFCYRTLSRLRLDAREHLAWAGQYQQLAEQLAREEILPGEKGTEALTGDAVPGVRLE